jgi:hypothetical protein
MFISSGLAADLRGARQGRGAVVLVVPSADSPFARKPSRARVVGSAWLAEHGLWLYSEAAGPFTVVVTTPRMPVLTVEDLVAGTR